MSVTYDITATIRAQMGGHPPVVLLPNQRNEDAGEADENYEWL